ncbi:hypothetical protein [Neobacillus ginsengisoli]|uniref:Transposase n=1 Tax=Neobacillus ginsengisoli TaxID=904295 RepID=A0ABT9XYI4_9BACI|nr:hypothetical protein [Neobacillus ginsengisoli]MDQ0200628.1 hypothetical protein [Neobacillus ginsengisoli]
MWVTEVWSNEDAHQKSLALKKTKETIQRARPLIAGIESIKILQQGGKGRNQVGHSWLKHAIIRGLCYTGNAT